MYGLGTKISSSNTKKKAKEKVLICLYNKMHIAKLGVY